MRLLKVLFIVVFFAYTQAVSNANPNVIFHCDALSDKWGCPPSQWEPGRWGPNRLNCLTPGRLMSWASETVRTNDYKLSAKIGFNDITFYVPGHILNIVLEVKEYSMKYRGLLLYAETDAGTRVGEWKLFDDSPAVWQLPWPSEHHCGNSVMHKTAAIKPLKTTFKFVSPPAGTGTIHFRALVKQGDANLGGFYTPNLSGDITLTESDYYLEPQLFFRTQLGQSCYSRCKEEGKIVDQKFLDDIRTQHDFESYLGHRHVCKLPFLSGCNSLGITSSKDGLCYYDDETCEAQGRSKARVTQWSASMNEQNGYRYCPCIFSIAETYGKRSVLEAMIQKNSASTSRIPVLFLISLLLLSFNHGSKRLSSLSLFLAVLAVSLCVLPTGTRAHNWIKTPSRAVHASTEQPCPSRLQNAPHVQVQTNQFFEIEWTQGHHNSFTYFAVVADEDKENLVKHSAALFEQYISEAPAESTYETKSLHRRYTTRPEDKSYLYKREILPNDRDFWPRHEAFGDWTDRSALFEYKDIFVEDNIHVAYDNPEIPWIKAIYRYKHVDSRPFDSDVARFTIPTTGQYVVHYVWNGYSDCIDIDVLDTHVENIYGVEATSTEYTRIDHCHAPDYLSTLLDCARVVRGLDYCKSLCSRGDQCSAIIVAPLVEEGSFNVGILPDDCYNNINDTTLLVDRRDVYMCFLVKPRVPGETFGPWEMTDDPLDPVYQSTCFLRNRGRQFPGFVSPTRDESISWKHGEKCISCKAQEANKDLSVVPRWKFEETCINCDLEPPPTLDTLAVAPKTHDSHACDGFDNGWLNRTYTTCDNVEERNSCVIRLYQERNTGIVSRQNIFPEECIQFAAENPDCSEHLFMFHIPHLPGLVKCSCISQNPCCNGCNVIPRDNFSIHRLTRGTSVY